MAITDAAGRTLAATQPFQENSYLPLTAWSFAEQPLLHTQILENPAPFQKAIALPIYFNDDQVLGILYFAGDLSNMMPWLKLITSSIHLWLQQAADTRKEHTPLISRQHFLSEWLAFDGDTFPSTMIENGQQYQIDIRKRHRLIAVKDEKGANFLADVTPNILTIDQMHIGILSYDNWPISVAIPQGLHMGISMPLVNAAKARHQAIRALELAEGLPLDPIVDYQHAQYLDQLLQMNTSFDMPDTWQNVANAEELIETFWYFFKHNGHFQNTAEVLHIHRNTLNYRLDRIKETTGLDPRRYDDLVVLYLSLIRDEATKSGLM
jgi:carbohydrate diacid regulator